MIRLTDEQWERIPDHFPEEHIADGRLGRKPIASRRVLEAVLWILNTGAQWHCQKQTSARAALASHRLLQTGFIVICQRADCRNRITSESRPVHQCKSDRKQ
jgi:transposase